MLTKPKDHVLVILILTLMYSAIANAAWSPERYSSFNYLSFFLSERTNERILLQKVDYELLNAAIHYATNSQRHAHGLPEFRHSQQLEKSASEHAKSMVRLKFYSHTSPLAGFETLRDRLNQVGIFNVSAAENIAISFAIEHDQKRSFYPSKAEGQFSYKYLGEPIKAHRYITFARSVVSQWMYSPEHRKSILNTSFSHQGNGTAVFFDEQGFPFIMVVQNFADIEHHQ